MNGSRFTVGIDLGTSNCALSYVDCLAELPTVHSLAIEQFDESLGIVQRTTLPSFLYFPTAAESRRLSAMGEVAHGSGPIAGELARQRQFETPDRVVHSAKSWLVHSGVDRTDRLLPWRSEEISPAERLSPVHVSAAYLRYLKNRWDEQIAAETQEYRLTEQTVTITVPASFDESAQQLTLEAAKEAGFPEGVRLLEEPQAAFYHWLSVHQSGGAFTELFQERQTDRLVVLVCDVGGGTTDFSLFEIDRPVNNSTLPAIKRVRVSDHILLGGDNIDLSVALLAAEKAQRGFENLSRSQWQYLVAQSRRAKEQALSCDNLEGSLRLSIPGSGSNLFEGTQTVEVATGEIVQQIIDGFFPECESSTALEVQDGGFAELGLPYARDSRVTVHLAGFLAGCAVDAVLYTGGTLLPASLRDRLTSVISSWQSGDKPVELVNSELDLAVAHGAGWYGHVLQTDVGRIRGGYPRSVYLQVADSKKGEEDRLVCMLPKGAEPGREVHLSESRFQLRLDAPARFQLLAATDRPQDQTGEIFGLNEFHALKLPPIETVLKRREGMKRPPNGVLEVELRARLSETGMLQLFLEHQSSGAKRYAWELSFEVRRSSGERSSDASSAEAEINPKRLVQASQQIRTLYGKGKDTSKIQLKPGRLVRALEKTLGREKSDWDLGTLRMLWNPLAEGVTRRGRSVQHERTWLNLAGFLLRPGFGEERDAVRLIQLWRAHELGLRFPKEASVQVQWWVMWRRVAGGLDRLQQKEIYEKVKPFLTRKGESSEAIRLAASLERLPSEEKERLGEILLDRIADPGTGACAHHCWAFGRLASRAPFHAPGHCVLSPQIVERWLDRLLTLDWSSGGRKQLVAAFSLAARLVNDRALCIDQRIQSRIVGRLVQEGAAEEFLQPLRELTLRDEQETADMFGEALPVGILLAPAEA